MADLSTVAASVAVIEGREKIGVAGVAITAGNSIYKKASDSRWYLADANVTDAEAGEDGVGIATSSAPGAGQKFSYLDKGKVNLGVALTVGSMYCVSATAGAIAPSGDLSSTQYISFLGTPESTSVLVLNPIVTGAVKA